MIMRKTGISKSSLAHILNGRSRDGQQKYGLLHKCPFLMEERQSLTELGKQIAEDKITTSYKLYTLPTNYCPESNSMGIAYLVGRDDE